MNIFVDGMSLFLVVDYSINHTESLSFNNLASGGSTWF